MEIELTHQSNNGDHELLIECDINYGRPACLTGHPDTWTPAEYDEIDIQSIFLMRNGRMRKLPEKLTESFSNDDDFINRVIEVSKY